MGEPRTSYDSEPWDHSFMQDPLLAMDGQRIQEELADLQAPATMGMVAGCHFPSDPIMFPAPSQGMDPHDFQPWNAGSGHGFFKREESAQSHAHVASLGPSMPSMLGVDPIYHGPECAVGANTSRSSLPVSSGSSEMTDISMTDSVPGQVAPGMLPRPCLDGPFLDTYNVGSPYNYGAFQRQVNHGSFPSSPEGMQSPEGIQTSAWNSSTTDSAELLGSVVDLGSCASSGPMSREENFSRTPSGFSVTGMDTNSSTHYPSPNLSIGVPHSRKPSMAQSDPLLTEGIVPMAAEEFSSHFGLDFDQAVQSPTSPSQAMDAFGISRSNMVSPGEITSETPRNEILLAPRMLLKETEDLGPLPQTHGPIRRRSSNDPGPGSGTARTHALYQATPHPDRKLHCPFEGQEGCNHKPTNLKCNYDKYVDSHIKPYRCHVPTCSKQQFSSTACLLRHEREAHGMHGHGPKPYGCDYPDCDRSKKGKGFPRRWNLFDHKKRVHNYTGDLPSTIGTSPVASTSVTSPGPRKRKTSGSQANKKSKGSAPNRQKNTNAMSSQTQPPSQHAQLLERARAQHNTALATWQEYSRRFQASRTSLDHQQLEVQTEMLRNVEARVRQLDSDLGPEHQLPFDEERDYCDPD